VIAYLAGKELIYRFHLGSRCNPRHWQFSVTKESGLELQPSFKKAQIFGERRNPQLILSNIPGMLYICTL
jgi:hypothetical protein